MYWKLHCEKHEAETEFQADGRFVLHRHVDTQGEHLDLRLEQGNALTGWRIDAADLDGETWAASKAPHPIRWLDDDAGLTREDAGLYAWQSIGADRRILVLNGREGWRIIRAERETALPPTTVREVIAAMQKHRVDAAELGKLLHDGAHARERAIGRLCGLGRELDGGAFDEAAWRKSLAGLALDEIHGQLRAFEVRFDAKYPPQPVSVPEVLPEEGDTEASHREAWRILNEV